MSETRTVHDPFFGETVEVSNDVNRPTTKTGKVPWKIVYRKTTMGTDIFAIIDADGHELFLCVSPEIAGRIVGAVNMVECAHKKADAQ